MFDPTAWVECEYQDVHEAVAIRHVRAHGSTSTIGSGGAPRAKRYFVKKWAWVLHMGECADDLLPPHEVATKSYHDAIWQHIAGSPLYQSALAAMFDAVLVDGHMPLQRVGEPARVWLDAMGLRALAITGG